MDGIFNIYKQKGFTSHDVVAVVRKTIQQKKVGHTGTLDPDAEGVLPICVGKGTKLAVPSPSRITPFCQVLAIACNCANGYLKMMTLMTTMI